MTPKCKGLDLTQPLQARRGPKPDPYPPGSVVGQIRTIWHLTCGYTCPKPSWVRLGQAFTDHLTLTPPLYSGVSGSVRVRCPSSLHTDAVVRIWCSHPDHPHVPLSRAKQGKVPAPVRPEFERTSL